MGVIELQGESLGEFPDAGIGEIIHDVQHVLQRAGHEEVLLEEPQALARLRLVVRVQHLGDCLGRDLVLNGLVVVAGVESLQCERLNGPCAPQRQHVAGVDSVTLDRRVVRDAFQKPALHPPDAVMADVVHVALGVAAPLDQIGDVGFGYFPRVSAIQPVVRLLDLPAVVDLLVEDSKFVADAVADRGTFERGQRVQVTRSEPAKATVAQTWFHLASQHIVEILTHRGQGGLCRVLHAQIQQVIAQLRTHEELSR